MNETALSTRDDAVARAERIRVGIRSMTELQQDIADAYHARDWVTLGYESWDAYVTGEFGKAIPRMDRGERRELVVNLRAEGLSTRAIAAAVGVDQKTVVNDARAVSTTEENSSVAGEVDEPRPIIGVNGKAYEQKRPPITAEQLEELKPENLVRTEPKQQQASRRAPLPKFAGDKIGELWRQSDVLQRIVKDERFAANRDTIRQQCEAELNLINQNLIQFCEALDMKPAAPAS